MTLADHAHGVVYPAAAQTLLGKYKAFTGGANHVVEWYAAVVEAQVRVATNTIHQKIIFNLARVMHCGDVAHQFQPGRAFGHDYHSRPLVRWRIRVGHTHHYENVGYRSIGRKPLFAIENPFVAIALAAGGNARGVGA